MPASQPIANARTGELIEQNGESSVVKRGDALMQTRTTYSTAIVVQRPRDLLDVKRRLEQEADLAGEDFYYSFPAGKDRIEGASIELALSAARCFGNCVIEAQPVIETPDAFIYTSAFVDLETGFTLTRQFRQSKNKIVYGKFDDERKEDIRFQIGQSKAHRNVTLNAMPASLIRAALQRAKDNVKGALEKYLEDCKKNGMDGMVEAVQKVLRGLMRHGVKEDRVLKKLGLAKREAIDIDDLVMIRGDLSALESGREYASTLYPEDEPPTNTGGNNDGDNKLPAGKKDILPKGKDEKTTTDQPTPTTTTLAKAGADKLPSPQQQQQSTAPAQTTAPAASDAAQTTAAEEQTGGGGAEESNEQTDEGDNGRVDDNTASELPKLTPDSEWLTEVVEHVRLKFADLDLTALGIEKKMTPFMIKSWKKMNATERQQLIDNITNGKVDLRPKP